MHDESRFVAIVRERQKAIRRECDRRGIAMKAVAQDSRIPYPTLLTYFPADANSAPAQIPGGAIYALAEGDALPNDLLSLLLPAGRVIVSVPEHIDHDEIASACRAYIDAKDRAHHPESPAGREIAPCEDDELRSKFAVVTGGKAAA